MLTLRNTFKYQGDVKQSPFPRITVAALFPIFEYARTNLDGGAVSRKVVSNDRAEADQDLGADSYRISAPIADLAGTSGDTIANFMAYTAAAMAATSVSDLSFPIPVQFSAAATSVGGSTLQAIYLVKGLRNLADPVHAVAMFKSRTTISDPAAALAYLEKNLFLVNKQAYENSLAEFKKLTGRNDDWLLLEVIQRFVEDSAIDPGSPFEFTKAFSAIVARILQAHEVESRDEIVRFFGKNVKDWLDFPILIPAFRSVTVAGVFQVNTPDGSAIGKDDLLFYDLSLEYASRGFGDTPSPRIVHYDWKGRIAAVSQNKTPFSFAGTGQIIPANVVGTITVGVKGFDGTLLWVREYDPNDPNLKEVMIVVSQVRPATLTTGATNTTSDTGKRLRGQVIELTKKCTLKDITVVIQAKKDGDEIWRVVAAASTDASGSFSMSYPYGIYSKAQAILSLTPQSPADIPIRDVGPNATIADDFLYLLMREPDCSEPDKSNNCDCDTPKQAPRLPGQADLINSSAYTQDIGGSCVNLSTPNRTLSEYGYTGIVRTSDPAVANYTLTKNQADGSFELKGDQKRIVRAPVDLDNPIRWQDAPDFKEDLTFYQAVTVATGHILHYKAEFKADGYSLGNLLYSLGLAPGQKKQIVVMDSAHSLRGAESQNIVQAESLHADLLNERNIADQIGGNINEALRGSSSSSTSGVSAGLGIAGSYGGAISGALGISGGNSSASSSASQNSSRDTSMFFGEKLRQSIMQNADSYRQLNASVVTAVDEGQHYSVTTDVVANHNHCHAMTMMYFEVLRHYAIFQELVNVEECIFVPLLMTNFSTENIYKWSDVLARNLLPLPSNTYLQPYSFLRYRVAHPLIPAFDANQRIKTNYAFVDFPKGAFCDEPITSVTGYVTIRLNIPRPQSIYDRIKSFPVVKQSSTVDRNGGGIFGGIADLVVGERKDITTWDAKVKFTDEHIVIYDNFQEARPADVIEVIKFDNFFANGSKDELLWTAIGVLCGYSDVKEFLANYFSHKTISQWDATFNEEIAPVVFEALVDNTISISPFSAMDFTTVGKYNGGARLMRLNFRCDTSLPRKDIANVRIIYAKTFINAAKFWQTATFVLENVSINYTTKHYQGFILNKWIGTDLSDSTWSTPTIVITPMNSDEQRDPHKEDQYLVLKLIEHLNSNVEHYNKALWYNLDPDRRYMLLDGFNLQIYNDFGLPDGTRSLASVVKNQLMTITGNSLVFPVAAGYKVGQSYITVNNREGQSEDVSLFDHYKPLTPVPPYRISVPSKGVFLEAVQGACDACERVKENSSQDWTKFQTDEPTPVLPVTTPVPTITDWKAAFKEFAPPMINIQNAPALPAPAAGLAGITELLGKPGIFKDITGLDATQQNAIRTYLSNQENAKAFAEMAKSMLTQDHNTQHSDKIMESLKTAKDSGAISQDDYGKLVKDHIQKQIDGGDSQKQQAAQQSKQLETSPIQSAVGLAQLGSRVSATESDSEGNTKTINVGGNADLQTVGDSYARPAWTKNQLAGLLGERLAVRVLQEEGHLVFTDWRKHISGNGIDLISLDKATGELWVIDNKAQMRGISGADALTGPQFQGSEQEMRRFFEKIWPNKAEADLALKAIDAKKVRLAVSNAFAGEKTRFTKALFDKGLHAFDIRFTRGKRFYGTFAAWEAAFKSLVTLRRGVRATGSRGFVTVEGMLVVAAVAAGAMYLLTGGSALKQVAGAVAADIAVDVVLSKLPGGLFAALVIGMESDESPAARAARKREEQIDGLMEIVPNLQSLSPEEVKDSRAALKELLDGPIVIEDPPDPPKGGINLPGFHYKAPGTDWT